MNKNQNNIIWRNILGGESHNKLTKPLIIVNRIVQAIKDNVLKPDSRLLSQRDMMKAAGVGKQVIADAMTILRDEKYIYTDGTNGSFVSNEKRIIKPVKNNLNLRHVLFCQETILATSPTVKELNRKLISSKSLCQHYNSIQRKEHTSDELLSDIQLFLNDSISLTYSLDSIYCAHHRHHTLDIICRTFLKEDEIFVTVSPVEQKILNMVAIHGGRVEYISTNYLGVSISALEILCKTKKVRILHIQSRSMFNRSIFSVKQEKKILELQEEYKFIIIEDDLYAGMFKKTTNSLLEKANKKEADVIYLTPLSLLDYEISQVMAIAANPEIIDKLKTMMIATGNDQNIVLLKAIHLVIESGILRRTEAKVYKKMQRVITYAHKFLQNTDLWKMGDFHAKESWFFYLEPLKGVFSANIYELLSKKNIDIMNANDYSWHGNSPHGIIISIAAYLDDDRMEEDLNILMITLQQLIITS